jgi:predicted PurR-regulated permease PerM
MNAATISRSVQALLLIFLVLGGLYIAKPFIVPLIIAGILATLMLPLAKRMEERGIKKGLAAFLCVLMLVFLVATIISLLIWQIAGFADDMAKLQDFINQYVQDIRQFLHDRIGLPMASTTEAAPAAPKKPLVATMIDTVGSVMGVVVTVILLLVYTFLFIYMRGHLKQFILKIIQRENRPKAMEIIDDSSHIAQRYVTGMGKMIIFLWVMYSIGFSIVGVKYAIFFAVLCGILEIVPFIGNIIGNALTIMMSISQQGDGSQVVGILITYGIVQFVQSYILEPMVVGSQVRLNPLSTIMAIILGEMLWGIPGMILAVPLMGMAKIIFDNVEILKPYGFLIGDDRKGEPKSVFVTIKGWFGK